MAKILKVGDSAAVTIPKKTLEEMGIKIGDDITTIFNKKTKSITIKPTHSLSNEDLKILKLTLNFINKYRNDLESLAKK